MKPQEQKIYKREECVTFLKTNEPFGGLSNMAGGYPLLINNVRVLTSEALYQACRFPHMPEVQKLIVGQKSPMTAKMVGKPYRKDSRSDWDDARIRIMYWCLRVKLAQNWEKFGDLLHATENKPIVEVSRRDQFWGAKPVDTETLIGENMLGRLLMKLRDTLRVRENKNLLVVNPPFENFLFMGIPIGVVESNKPVTKHIQPLDIASHNPLPLPFTETRAEPFTRPIPSVELTVAYDTTLKQTQLF